MGKTKTKFMDDSQPTTEIKSKKLKVKNSDKAAKLESAEAVSEVQSAPEAGTSVDPGSEQTHSERTGDASGASRSSEPTSDNETPKKKAQKMGKAKPRSKKYQAAVKDLDKSRAYPVNEAVDLVKKLSYSKFEGSLEAHINTIQTGIRGLVSLPFASGKKLKILAFGPGLKEEDGVTVGTDETLEAINEQSSPSGKGFNYDLVVTTPDWMPKLAKIARFLGPRGLMPNPKNGTITNDLKKTIEGFMMGKTEFKTESKAPVIHLGLGKLNQPTEELSQNIKTLLQTLGKTKVKKISLSPTMGPSVKVDLASI